MKTKQIIDILQDYNDWRRARGKWDIDTFNKGESLFDAITAHEIGLTLDSAIERLQTLEQERDEARREARCVRAFYEGQFLLLGDDGMFVGGWRFSWEKGSE